MAKEIVVTHEGLKKLEEELNNLRTVKRKEVADKIKVARGYGDLSENADTSQPYVTPCVGVWIETG